MTEPAPEPPRVAGGDVLRVAFATLGLMVAAGALLALAYAILVVFGFEGVAAGFAVPTGFTLEAVAVMAALWLVMVRRRGFTWRDLGWVPVSRGWVALGGVAALAILAAALSLELLYVQVTGDEDIPLLAEAMPRSVPGFIAVLASGAVAAPIAEEFLFRGMFYRWLRGRWGVAVGAVVSAFTFSALHLPGAADAVHIFVIGLALAWLYERSGSLWPAMMLHGVNNAVSLGGLYAILWFGPA